jgi:hypothetical protein
MLGTMEKPLCGAKEAVLESGMEEGFGLNDEG